MDIPVSSTALPAIITGSIVSAPHAAAITPSTTTIRRPTTSRKHHEWSSFQLVHAMILKQHGGLGSSQIAQLLNTHFLTNMSGKTVHHRMSLEAGTLAQSESKKRTDQGQMSASILWDNVKDCTLMSLEVGFVLFKHGLLTHTEWMQRAAEYHDTQEEQEQDAENLLCFLAILAVPNRNRITSDQKIERE